MSDVKGGNKRTEKARLTRRRMIDAAHELFVERGYGATSLQDVADRAGVAVQTIYFTFGNKRSVLKELVDVVIAGDDEPLATMERPWFRDMLAAETAGDALWAHVQGTRRVLDRYAPIDEVVRAAVAADPDVALLWPEGEEPRYTVQRAAASSLVAKPGARAGVSADHAADVLFGLLGPQVYLVFVRDRCWPSEQWEAWVHETLFQQLCE